MVISAKYQSVLEYNNNCDIYEYEDCTCRNNRFDLKHQAIYLGEN